MYIVYLTYKYIGKYLKVIENEKREKPEIM